MRKARSLRARVQLLAAVSITTALTVAGVTLAITFNRQCRSASNRKSRHA